MMRNRLKHQNAREKGVEGGNDAGTKKEGSGCTNAFWDHLTVECGE